MPEVGVHVDGGRWAGRGWGDFVRRVDALGLDSLWLGDHLVSTADPGSPYPYGASRAHPEAVARGRDWGRFETIALLAHASALTARLVLGTSVVVLPQRDPVLLARQALTLDHLTQGRFRLGVGVGWARAEFEALGVPYEERFRRTDEYLRVLAALWEEGPLTRFAGEFVAFDDVFTSPGPHTPSGPPLYVGGNGPAGRRRAAAAGAAWFPMGGSLGMAPEALRDALDEAPASRVAILVPTPGWDGHGPADPDAVSQLVDAYAAAGADEIVFKLASDVAAGPSPEELAAVAAAARRPLRR